VQRPPSNCHPGPLRSAGNVFVVLKLYDTAQARLMEVTPRVAGEFSMYNCGPTVYGLPHLGHGRFALTYDVLRRYLEWTGLKVRHAQNITDVDDKIIALARAEGVDASVICDRYEAEWWKAMDAMGLLRPTDQPHATAYIDKMVALIAELVDNGSAYETSDGVYFMPTVVADYGLLARQTIESLQSGASGRVQTNDEKRSPIDFALWKKTAGPGDLPQWQSPWGAGRPGWHTECVVMSLDLLGEGFDLHSGGLDLSFPHHENERAQAVAWGKTFARHWIHNGFVETEGVKMSKSLNNFTSLTDLLTKVDPRAYRFLVLRSHYRSPIEVTADTLAEAEAALARFDALARRVGSTPSMAIGLGAASSTLDAKVIAAFEAAMSNDLDTPGATAQIFEAIRRANTALDAGDAVGGGLAAATAFELAGALGVFASTDAVDSYTTAKAAALDAARAAKDFGAADALRAELQAEGWTVETTKAGTRLYR
jgi:cysteinyl-tRNA synthetase